MHIKIEGDPGTGNTFQEVHIGTVQNYVPNATEVINNYYGTRETLVTPPTGDQHPKGSTVHTPPPIDTTLVRRDILSYVSCLRSYLADGWKQRYMKLWEGILDLDAVSTVIYSPGKQQSTTFNRNLVARIIHYLGGKGLFLGVYNANEMARALEGDVDHSVRHGLLQDPDTSLCQALDNYLETFLL